MAVVQFWGGGQGVSIAEAFLLGIQNGCPEQNGDSLTHHSESPEKKGETKPLASNGNVLQAYGARS